jgi:hypothetical protein
MLSISSGRVRNSHMLRSDFAMIAFLIGLDVAARFLPHPPDFTPIAASALFAASILRVRAMAVVVPIAGMMIGDAVLGSYDLRVMTAVYATLTLPAGAAFLSNRLRPRLIAPIVLSSSLLFFVITNLAVWAFSPMYTGSTAGLVKCYIAALPFLRNMLAGDLFWGLVLFGGYWLAQKLQSGKSEALTAEAIALPVRR